MERSADCGQRFLFCGWQVGGRRVGLCALDVVYTGVYRAVERWGLGFEDALLGVFAVLVAFWREALYVHQVRPPTVHKPELGVRYHSRWRIARLLQCSLPTVEMWVQWRVGGKVDFTS